MGGSGTSMGGFGPANRNFDGPSFPSAMPTRGDAGFPQQFRIGGGRDDALPGSPSRDTFGFDQPSANQQRILNQRLEQAEHLRQISAENGNTRLGETADRMEQNAQQRFAHQHRGLDSLQNRQSAPSAEQSPSPEASAAKKPSFFARLRRLWPFK
jgi:hypothetical protein